MDAYSAAPQVQFQTNNPRKTLAHFCAFGTAVLFRKIFAIVAYRLAEVGAVQFLRRAAQAY
jgi:hypothetical protein